MKVKHLIEKLKGLDPEIDVVLSGSDHSYSVASGAQQVDAEQYEGDTQWGPEYGEWYPDNGQGDPVQVFVVY